jgi:hypothetical protein
MKPSAFAVVLAFVLTACRNAPPDVHDEPPLPRAGDVPPNGQGPAAERDAGGAREAEREDARRCEPALAVTPSVVATQWPSLIGKRVRFHVTSVRALSVFEQLVTAGGQHFVVMAAPDTHWNREHVFVVTGSTNARVHGHTQLPELALDDDCSA